MEYGLIGEHLTHSYSCEIHGQIADYTYELCEVAPEALDEFMSRAEFKAINVTIPYKQAVIPYLSYISPQAESIGAVNTIVNREGKLYGYNTDFMGMEALIREMGLSLGGKKVLILGTGGTSRTAWAVCEAAEAGEVYKVSRRSGGGALTYEEAAREHSDAQIIINTTPVGMYPQSEAAPLDISGFTRLEGIVDAVYNPLRTELVLSGQRRGIPAEGGLYMLSGQGVAASAIFRGIETETELIGRVFRRIRNQKRNIVLIGMPTSGKTTVGALLAGESGREFLDTDILLEERLGESTAAYLRREGEAAFRDRESEVIAEVADRSGCIIATGGGSVLREENVRRLKRNGVLVFLNRAPEKLIAADDRPLSSDREALMQRYRERYEIYMAAADVVIDANVTLEEEVRAIWEETEK